MEETDITPEGGTNGARKLTREEVHARDRAAFLADEPPIEETSKKPPPVVKKPPPDVDDEEPDESSLDADEDDEEETEIEDILDDVDDEDDEKPDVDEEPDDETSKRKAQVRRTEQRARAALDRDRADFERQRTEWQTRMNDMEARVQKFEQARARAKHDPAALLEAAGLTADDDFELAARQLFALSPKLRNDPKHREAVARELAQRASSTELAATQKRIADLEEKLSNRDKDAAAQQVIDDFMGKVVKAAGPHVPLAAELLEKNPAKTRARLRYIADRLAVKMKGIPTPRAVIAALEKSERRIRAERGIEVPAAGKAAVSKDTTGTVGGKPKAGTNGEGKKPELSKTPTRDDIVAELEAGDLDLS